MGLNLGWNLNKIPNRPLQLTQRIIHCLRSQPQGVFFQAAAFVEDREEHQAPAKFFICLAFRITVSAEEFSVEFALSLNHPHAAGDEFVFARAAAQNQALDNSMRAAAVCTDDCDAAEAERASCGTASTKGAAYIFLLSFSGPKNSPTLDLA